MDLGILAGGRDGREEILAIILSAYCDCKPSDGD